MKLINKSDPTSKTLYSIAKFLKKFPQGIQKRFDELGIKGTEYNGRIWYSQNEIERLKEYIEKSEIPLEYKYSINNFKNELNRDYGTIRRIFDYLEIKGYTDLHNKTFYNEEEKQKLYEFNSKYSPLEIQRILSKNTSVKNYGVDNPMKNKEVQHRNHYEFNKRLEILVKEFEKENGFEIISTKKLCQKFNRDKTTMHLVYKELNLSVIEIKKYYFINKNDVPKLIDYFNTTENHIHSYKEKELVDFIKSLNVDYIENDRNIISPKELDIYIPSRKLAIEFDGLYYHSELFVNENYHYDKTNSCNKKGIDLIHVFEDDWKYKRPIVESMIKSRLGIYKRKIFARKCKIKQVDNSIAKSFLNDNHLQGYASTSNIHLGLYYENELVQLISITHQGWHDGNTELTRMATKLNTQVIGGFSRLIKYFCKEYNCNYIVSYVYKAWFNGKGYNSVGFNIIKENLPTYYYILSGKRMHKSMFRKSKLNKMYKNKIIKNYKDNMTEGEICMENKIYKIYDCGTVKVEYKI